MKGLCVLFVETDEKEIRCAREILGTYDFPS